MLTLMESIPICWAMRAISPVKVTSGFGERRLVADNYTQSRSLNKDGLTGSYWDGFINEAIKLNIDSRVLILGLGGGTIAKMITNKFGRVYIDGVEIDSLMVELGKNFLDFSEKNVKIIKEDAKKFVKDARFKYDLVCVDLFSHGNVAQGTETKSFFEDVKRLVNKDGVVVINKIFTSNSDLKKYVDFLHEIFSKTDILLIRGSIRTDNVIVYAYN